MKFFLLTTAVAVLSFTAPAFAAGTVSVSLTPLITAQNTNHIPTLVTTCASPNESAHVVGDPYFEMPSAASDLGQYGMATVQIDLNPNGVVTKQNVFASSGSLWLDNAAMLSARMTRFAAETRNCEHIGGSYLYAVDFTPAQ